MKILQMMDEPWDSGITSNALHLSEMLSAKAECWVLAPEGSHAALEAKRLGLKSWNWKGSPWLHYFGIARWIASQNFDVLHAHTGSMHSLAWVLSRFVPGLRLARTRADARPIKKNFLSDKVVRGTHFFIFPTESMREKFLITYDYPIERARKIGVALSREWMRSLDEPVPQKKSEELVVAMVGRLDSVKGHEDLIRAVELAGLDGLRYEIIGAEKNVKMQDLMALARKLGVERKFHLRGFLEPKALIAAMKEADIAVIASRGSEEVSRVCVEWMSLAKPIAATRVGQIAELLENGLSGILTHPAKHEELAYAIKRLAKDAGLRRMLGENAKKTFDAKYSPQNILGAHWTLYQEASGALNHD